MTKEKEDVKNNLLQQPASDGDESKAENELKHYELVYLISNKYSEDEIEPIMAGINKLITDNGGKIIAEDNWGKRRLAYQIKNFFHAYYVVLEFDLAPEAMKKLDKHLRLSDEILRHLVVIKRIKSKDELKREKQAAENRATEIAEKQKLNKQESKETITKAPQKPRKEVEKLDIEKLDEKIDKILENTEDLIK